MGLNEEQLPNRNQIRRRYLQRGRNNLRVSFSASLPNDVYGVFAGSLCAVKYSEDPFADIRDSIEEMIKDVEVLDWSDVEELAHCYIALNSSEIHEIIRDAFLSLSCYFKLVVS